MRKFYSLALTSVFLVASVLKADDPFAAPSSGSFGNNAVDPFAAPSSSSSSNYRSDSYGDKGLKDFSVKRVLESSGYERDDMFVLLKKRKAFSEACSKHSLDDPAKWSSLKTRIAQNNVKLSKEIAEAKSMMDTRDTRSSMDGKVVSGARARAEGKNLYQKYQAEYEDNESTLRIIGELESVLDGVRQSKPLTGMIDIKSTSGRGFVGSVVMWDGDDTIIEMEGGGCFRVPVSSLSEETVMAVNVAGNKTGVVNEEYVMANVVEEKSIVGEQAKELNDPENVPKESRVPDLFTFQQIPFGQSIPSVLEAANYVRHEFEKEPDVDFIRQFDFLNGFASDGIYTSYGLKYFLMSQVVKKITLDYSVRKLYGDHVFIVELYFYRKSSSKDANENYKLFMVRRFQNAEYGNYSKVAAAMTDVISKSVGEKGRVEECEWYGVGRHLGEQRLAKVCEWDLNGRKMFLLLSAQYDGVFRGVVDDRAQCVYIDKDGWAGYLKSL